MNSDSRSATIAIKEHLVLTEQKGEILVFYASGFAVKCNYIHYSRQIFELLS